MLVLVFAVLAVLGLYWLLGGEEKKGKLIPGPKGWPFVGMGFELNPQNMFTKGIKYAQRFGDIVQFQIFGNTIVMLNSAECVRKAFTTNPYKKFMNDRRSMFFTEKFMYGSSSVAFIEHAASNEFSDLKKAYIRGLRHYGDGRKHFEEIVQNTLRGFVERIQSYGNSEFVLQDMLKDAVIDIMSILIAGHAVKTDEDSRAIKDIDRASIFFLTANTDVVMRVFPFVKWVPCVYRSRYREMAAAKQRVVQTYFDDVKATFQPGVTRGLVDFMLNEQLQALEGGNEVLFTNDKIKVTMVEAFEAGVTTSVGTISAIILCLLNHPGYQTKIQQELDRVIGRDRMPTLDDKHNCPMIEAVLMETLRYIPTAPGLIPHDCKSNIEFDGYDIPRNSVIIANVFHIHHDEKVWGDPWTFRPERFLDEHGEIVSNDHIYRKSWLPFGMGRRLCVGESLARSRIFLFVATLLQRWSFEFPPGRHISCDPRLDHFDFGLQIRVDPYYCRVVERELTL